MFSHCRALQRAHAAAQQPEARSREPRNAGSAQASGGGLTRVTSSGPIPVRAPATGPNGRRAWPDSDSNAGGNTRTPAAPPSRGAVVLGGPRQVSAEHRTGRGPTDPPTDPRTDGGRRKGQPPGARAPPAAPWDHRGHRGATEEPSEGCSGNRRRRHTARRSALSLVCFKMRA